jgi:hypothetical protein
MQDEDLQKKLSRKRKWKEPEASTTETSNNKTVISWIWRSGGGIAVDTSKVLYEGMSVTLLDVFAHNFEGLRLEYCKAYARVQRWREEVVLLQEEMRRTLVSLEWRANQWDICSSSTSAVDPHTEGVIAYAA